ncbi:MAG: bifunctional (p)ppGpp synthetase/guanosine-3',5'-bis(diphosphate) 3'-pyrophosphohydrolase [Paludibacteraceae bacterium]|nr:bifunctional (p)ppGpp synthetase/guanosine-3',5'-bis(diphosphate) 3'-pyrophosphohydrolase [Paludibacteraceae bacterium]
MPNVESTMTPEQEEQMIQQEFQALLNDYANTAHKQKIELITRAFEFAKSAHQGVRRRSGEPYIMHPLAVARIVVREIGLGSTSICAALMHDVVEDTDYTVEDIQERFGNTIAKIVEGLTKISGGQFGEQASKQAENFRRIILTMTEDVRVVIIKIADRLHNMRTLGSMPPAKQLKITGETEYIYAPLAHRLGLFNIKTELENLCFKYEHPETYRQIAAQLAQDNSARQETVNKFAEPIKKVLTEAGYKFTITSRVKTVYSIWRKMTTKNIPFQNIYDLLALRIIFEPLQNNESEKVQCWRIYSLLTSIYTAHPQRIRDWVSMPKVNGYEALHVTLMGPTGQWMEVQIRTTRMNDIAEKGLAAHWKYKEGTGQNYDTEFDKWLRTIKEMLQNPETDAIDFVDNFKLNLFKSEIMVFTPKGDSRMMPKGATVLDFAYGLHSELGNHCTAAKVNHQLVPLTYELNPGDQIEIITDDTQSPQPWWKQHVITAHAQECIDQYEKRQEKIARQKGENIIQETLIKHGREYNSSAINMILRKFSLTQPQELFLQVGLENISQQQIEDIIKPKGNIFTNYIKRITGNGGDDVSIDAVPLKDPLQIEGKTLVVSDENFESHCVLSQCCKPIPGDDTIGFLQDDNSVIIHKRSCPEAVRLKSSIGDKILNIKWGLHKDVKFNETIEIRGIDQAKLLSKILAVISLQENINLTELHITANAGMFVGRIHLLVQNTQQLNNLCKEIERIDKVDSVVRVLYDDETNKKR